MINMGINILITLTLTKGHCMNTLPMLNMDEEY